jgi:RNA polymerase sigma-70 factor (ECF subfamily)
MDTLIRQPRAHMLPTEQHRRSAITAGCSNERELELLRSIARHNRAAFRELFLIYHRRLARFLMRVTSQHDLIEEIINDTLWTVWLKASEFRGASLVSTWIVGIAYRRALKTLRQARHARDGAGGELGLADAADAAGVHDDDREWLQSALAELPLEQRLVLEFAYLMGHSCEEIAEIMQCPVNTVKTRMFHARQKLRVSLPRLAGMRPS